MIRRALACLMLMLALLAAAAPGLADSSAYYGYDPLGRLTTVLYGNGVCAVSTYDANGNRTAQTNSSAGAPESPVWGTGTWGCIDWTPQ